MLLAMAPPAYCPVCFTTFEGDPPECANMRCRGKRPAVGWPHLLGPGQMLDRHYRIDAMLAVGGAGVTYRAREVDAAGAPVEPTLAIKVLHTQRATGSFLQRLANEAQILQGLRNQHIVECMGFVQRRGQAPYLVTRFEPGGTLEDLVVDIGPLPAWTVAGVMRQVMEALAAAHKKGVVHRDLKPANILLRKRTARVRIPHVRVADFGIAKVGGGLADGLTRVGAFIGTPHFAAPEQFGGKDTGAATDVFAAGSLAFWLLTGRVYFDDPESGLLADYPDAILDSLPVALPSELLEDERGQRLAVLLDGLMRVDVARRWTVAQAIGYLDWVLGVRPGRPAWLATDQADPAPAPVSPPPAASAPGHGVQRGRPTQIRARTPARRTPARRVPEPLPPTDPGTRAAPPPRRTPPVAARPAPAPAPASRPVPAPRAAPAPASAPTARPGPSASALPSAPPPARTPARRTPARRTPARRPDVGPGPRVGRDDHRRASDPARLGARRTQSLDAPWTDETPRQGSDLSLEDIFGRGGPTGRTDHGDRDEVPYVPPELKAVRVQASGEPAWMVVGPMEMPHPMPDAGPDLMRVLAAVAPGERRDVSRLLLRLPPERLVEAVKGYAPGGDPTWGRGVGLAIELLRREDWEPIARSLLADPEPGVRIAGAAGLSRVGGVVTLKTLSNLLKDEEPIVRAAAVRALARCARAAGRGRIARYALQPLLQDPEELVADAAEMALVDLE